MSKKKLEVLEKSKKMKSWRDVVAENLDKICDVHLMKIPKNAKINREPVSWWKNRY